jgi:hypothetical protein
LHANGMSRHDHVLAPSGSRRSFTPHGSAPFSTQTGSVGPRCVRRA